MTYNPELNLKVRGYNALLEELKQEVGFNKFSEQGKQDFFSEINKYNPSDNVTIDGLKEYIKTNYSEEKLEELENKTEELKKSKDITIEKSRIE